MLPTTITNTQDWKAETFAVFSGLRGLCILWVFWQHSTMRIKGSYQSNPVTADRNNFNTATFLILTGFTTWMQQRGQKVRYSSFMLRNYFSLIPLNVLCIVCSGVPVSLEKVNISTFWQAYIVIANMCGFGMFSAAEGFTGAVVDPAKGRVLFASGSTYFGSMLFLLFGVYALFHWALTSSKTLRSLFQNSCIPAFVIAILMIVCSFLLGALDSNPITSLIAAGQIQLLPMLMLGVCASELRHQMSAKVVAVMGHWLTIDTLFAAFLAVTFWPYSYSYKVSGSSAAEGFKDPMSVALLTMQMVFFCLLLMALSCQAFHKKRSIIVHFVLRRTLLTDVFAKFSYTFYLFALPVLFVYYPAWVKMLPGGSQFDWNKVGWLQWILQLLMSMAVAMLAQWWQDEYVVSVYMSVRQYLDEGQFWNLWTSEQNPLCWHSEEPVVETTVAPTATANEDPLQKLEAQDCHSIKQQARS